MAQPDFLGALRARNLQNPAGNPTSVAPNTIGGTNVYAGLEVEQPSEPNFALALEQGMPAIGTMEDTPTQFMDPGRLALNQVFRQRLGEGVDQTQQIGGALFRMLGREMGNANLETYGQNIIDGNQAEIEGFDPTVHSLSEIHNFDDFLEWAVGGLGNAIPSLATAAVGGGIGGIVGRHMAKRKIANELTDRMLSDLTLKGFADDAAKASAQRTLSNPTTAKILRDAIKYGDAVDLRRGALRGSSIGMFMPSAAMMTGEAEQAGVKDPLLALGVGVAGGILETAAMGRAVRMFFPGVDKKVATNFVKDFAKATGSQALVEGSQEGAQQMIQMAALAYHDPSFDLMDPENAMQVLDSFAIGALVGGIMGAGGSAVGEATTRARNFRGPTSADYEELLQDPYFGGPGGRGSPEIDPNDPDGGGLPPDFEPADNTVTQEVAGRINTILRAHVAPAMNSIRSQVMDAIRQAQKDMPGAASLWDSVMAPFKSANDEFAAGSEAILEDLRRYAGEQTAYIVETAETITDPKERQEFIEGELATVEEEIAGVAEELAVRGNAVAERAGRQVQEMTLDDIFDNNLFVSKGADPDFTFGGMETVTTRQGVRFQRPTRGDRAKPISTKKAARNQLKRLKEMYPSATDDSFQIEEVDGGYVITLADQLQRDDLLDDEVASQGILNARTSARANPDPARTLRLENSTTIDVPTLAYQGRRLDRGDQQSLAESFAAITGRLLDRGTITDADFVKMQEIFVNHFTRDEQMANVRTIQERRKAIEEGRFKPKPDEKRAKKFSARAKARRDSEEREARLWYDALEQDEYRRNISAIINRMLDDRGLEGADRGQVFNAALARVYKELNPDPELPTTKTVSSQEIRDLEHTLQTLDPADFAYDSSLDKDITDTLEDQAEASRDKRNLKERDLPPGVDREEQREKQRRRLAREQEQEPAKTKARRVINQLTDKIGRWSDELAEIRASQEDQPVGKQSMTEREVELDALIRDAEEQIAEEEKALQPRQRPKVIRLAQNHPVLKSIDTLNSRLETRSKTWRKSTKDWTETEWAVWHLVMDDEISESFMLEEEEKGRQLTKEEKLAIIENFIFLENGRDRKHAKEFLPKFLKAKNFVKKTTELADERRKYVRENQKELANHPNAWEHWLSNFPRKSTDERTNRWQKLGDLLNEWRTRRDDKAWRDAQIARRRKYIDSKDWVSMDRSQRDLVELMESEIDLLETGDLQTAVDSIDKMLDDFVDGTFQLRWPKPNLEKKPVPVRKPTKGELRSPNKKVNTRRPNKERFTVWLPGMKGQAKLEEAVSELVQKVVNLVPESKTELRVISREGARQMKARNHPDSDMAEWLLSSPVAAIVTSPGRPVYIMLPETADMVRLRADDTSFDPGIYLAALSHELGHFIHYETWASLPLESQDEILAAFRADVKSGKYKSSDPREARDAPMKDTSYDFAEWMADQFIDWMIERKAPTTALEKFLEKVAKRLDSFWKLLGLQPKRYGMLNETYAEFMDEVARRSRNPNAGNGRFFKEGQMGRNTQSLFGEGPVMFNQMNLPPQQVQRLRNSLQNYPRIATNANKMIEFMKNAWYTAIAPSTNRMRDLSERGIRAADELVRMFNRQPHGQSKVGRVITQNYHQAREMMQGVFYSRMAKILKGASEAELFRLGQELRAMDGHPNMRPTTLRGRAIRKLLDEMHEYAREAGLPVGKIENYFPRTFDRQKLIDGEQEIITYLTRVYERSMHPQELAADPGAPAAMARKVYSGLISRDADADAALRELARDPLATQTPAGGFMRSRTASDKFFADYYNDNVEAVLANYINTVTKRAEYNRLLGQKAFPNQIGGDSNPRSRWDPKKRLKELLAEARAQGATDEDLLYMKNYVEANIGMYGRDALSEPVRKAMAGVVAYQNMRTLLFSVFASLPDAMGPAIRSGKPGEAFKTLFKNIGRIRRSESNLADMARTWGIISDAYNSHVLTEYVDNHYMPKGLRKWNDNFFKYTGLNWWTDFTRKAALSVGIDSIKNEALRAQTAPTARERAQAIRFLGELGLTTSDVNRWMSRGEPVWGSMTYTESNLENINADRAVANALVQFVDEAILRPNPSQRPMLANHPALMLVYHLKGFMYAMHDTIIKRLIHNFNVAKTPAEIAAVFVPAIGMMAMTAVGLELRELITGTNYTDRMDGWDYTWEVFERTGLPGLTQFAWDWEGASARGQSELAGLSGPAIGQVGDLLSKPTSQTIPKAIPVVSQLPWARDFLREATPL